MTTPTYTVFTTGESGGGGVLARSLRFHEAVDFAAGQLGVSPDIILSRYDEETGTERRVSRFGDTIASNRHMWIECNA